MSMARPRTRRGLAIGVLARIPAGTTLGTASSLPSIDRNDVRAREAPAGAEHGAPVPPVLARRAKVPASTAP